MVIIEFEGEEVPCLEGSNLRMALVHAQQPLYKSVARAVNCRGRGACGTCAVVIEGDVSEPTDAERKRLNLDAPDAQDGLRLACQCNVLGDVRVRKATGALGLRLR